MYKIEYKGEIIEYEIIKSNVKNIYIHIKEGKVYVKIPKKANEKYAHEFINKKAKWVCEKIKETNERKLQEKSIKITDEDIERLKEIVIEKVDKYSKLLNVRPNKVRIRDIKYAWGSCSSNKNITINKKLAVKEEKVIEYVVLHEMSHIIYMNHSKEFWGLVSKYMPEYNEYRKKLK